MKKPGHVLIVDDDRFSRSLYADVLEEEGHTVHTAAYAEEAYEILEREPIQVVVTDIFMPNTDGFEVLNHINDKHPGVDVIITTGYADVDGAVKALKSGAKDYLRKPINNEEFRLIVERCLEQQSLLTENQEYRRQMALVEACNRIASCLEIERLLPMSLHVLAQELHADEGLVLHRDPGFDTVHATSLTIGGVLDLDQLEKEYAPLLRVQSLLECRQFRFIESPGYPEAAKLTLILPAVVDEVVQAVFLLFFYRDSLTESFPQEVLRQRAEFIGRQVGLACDNATKFIQAREQVYIDDLTGLYNARYLSVVMERELKRSKRFEHSLSVLFMDLDRFKNVNDEFGHLIGSHVLVEVADILKICLREIDTAVRYGGDEYIVLLVNTDPHGARVVAERIRESIAAKTFVEKDGLQIKITASIGIASFPEHAQTVKDLIEMADQAMYRGKNTSRNVVYIFSQAQ